ncbi:MAG: acyl-homoserine-lactone synthase [Terricaulis sp.]|jgi:acyl-homoserine lactone synthase
MMHLVTEENRDNYRRELLEMHAHRKRVFIDQLQWPLASEGDREFDEFDADSVVYLLHFGANGMLAASARLLRTDRPHLLDTIFPHLCEGDVPHGEFIWEATRFCPSPHIQEPHARRVLLGEIIAGILEAGLLFGMTDVTFVAGGALKPLALASGWTAKTLGPTQRYRRDRVTACVASIDAMGLRRVRERHNLSAPLLRFSPARQAA